MTTARTERRSARRWSTIAGDAGALPARTANALFSLGKTVGRTVGVTHVSGTGHAAGRRGACNLRPVRTRSSATGQRLQEIFEIAEPGVRSRSLPTMPFREIDFGGATRFRVSSLQPKLLALAVAPCQSQRVVRQSPLPQLRTSTQPMSETGRCRSETTTLCARQWRIETP